MSIITRRVRRAIRKMLRNAPSQPDRLASRAALAQSLKANADERGIVVVLEGGRDCDGVTYSGLRHEITAHPLDFERLRGRIDSYADGPFWLQVVSPEVAADTRYSARDTFAEACGY